MTRALLLAAIALAASPAQALADDTRAREAVDRALAAAGGIERIEAQRGWIVEGVGRENLAAENQGVLAMGPTWRDHEEKVAVDATSLAVAWERKTPRNDQSLRWRRFIWRADSTGVFDWNVGRGSMRAGEASLERRRAIARRVPHLLLADVARRATRLTWLEERNVDQHPCDVVRAEFEDGIAPLELAIASDNPVVRTASYRTQIPGFGISTVTWRWIGWMKNDTLGFAPTGHRVTVNDESFQEVRYTRFAAAPAEAAALLALPRPGTATSGEQPAPVAAADLPATGEVAPGVHVYDASGFTVGWIEMKDFIVAFEAPESSPGLEASPAPADTTRRTRALVEAITRSAPNKPLRFAVISHHHGDHMGGVAEYARAGATLLVSPRHQLAAARAVASDSTAPKPVIEAVTQRRVIEDGTRRIEVLDALGNPHSGGSLCVWIPDAGIVFQGDLFYFQEGAPFPPSGRGKMNGFFARWLKTQGIRPRAIYGVHDDAPAGPAALDAAIALEP